MMGCTQFQRCGEYNAHADLSPSHIHTLKRVSVCNYSSQSSFEKMISPGVRKGAWSGEEDVLLRRCIELHGEGKWHLVPQRAGLNRCRKSCRLRWLNYLQPSLNREEFKEDEIDLIIKMHKLLGNRWSLIAGRIPGRTANDIKNYWNSRLSKRLGSKSKPNELTRQPVKRISHEVIRPQPRSFNVKVPPSQCVIGSNMGEMQQQEHGDHRKRKNMWWNELLPEDDSNSSLSSRDTDEGLFKNCLLEGTGLAMDPESNGNAFEWADLLTVNDWLIKE